MISASSSLRMPTCFLSFRSSEAKAGCTCQKDGGNDEGEDDEDAVTTAQDIAIVCRSASRRDEDAEIELCSPCFGGTDEDHPEQGDSKHTNAATSKKRFMVANNDIIFCRETVIACASLELTVNRTKLLLLYRYIIILCMFYNDDDWKLMPAYLRRILFIIYCTIPCIVLMRQHHHNIPVVLVLTVSHHTRQYLAKNKAFSSLTCPTSGNRDLSLSCSIPRSWA